MPKSGSTYLSNAIGDLPNFNVGVAVPSWGRREQELDDACLCRLEDQNYVIQVHVRYSDATQRHIENHHLAPIVLVRNIFDVVPSLIDHHRKESLLHPMAFVPEGIQGWSFEASARFVTTMVLPWYFNFYVSWAQVPNKLLVKYEDWILNPEKELLRISDYAKLDVSSQEVSRAVSNTVNSSPRKNVVTPGRGNALPVDCISQIHAMAEFYPGVDFAPIGITR